MMELILEMIRESIESFQFYGMKQSEEFLADYFKAEEWEKTHGRDDRFPSVVSAVARFLCRHLHFVVPLLYAVVMICSVVEGASVVVVLLGSVFKTIWYSFLIAIGFFALMLMESFAKITACLILYGELPSGAENPADALMIFLAKRKD